MSEGRGKERIRNVVCVCVTESCVCIHVSAVQLLLHHQRLVFGLQAEKTHGHAELSHAVKA